MSLPGSPIAGGGSHPLSVQVRVHQLNDGENLESVLFRVQKGWIIQFKLGPSLFGKKVSLYINYPENRVQGFQRSRYRQLTWKSQSLNKGDDTALYGELVFELSGTFHYFFIHSGNTTDVPDGSGFILVEPTLTYGPDNEVLPLDCILCQTYLSKCLGPLPEWEQRLLTSKNSGYNVIHFTPVQELGASFSAYSLKDQLKLNSTFHTPEKQYTIEDVGQLVEKMRKEWKILSITDIVLNHSANESEWLQEHPESCYNLVNSPHLRPAYLLDRVLCHFSLEIAAGKWAQMGIPPNVCEERHLDSIRSALYGSFLCKLKVFELFMVDVNSLVVKFRNSLPNYKPLQTNSCTEDTLKIIQEPAYRRWKSTVDMQLALRIYGSGCQSNVESACNAFSQKLEELNRSIKNEIEDHLNCAVENVIKAIRYERLDSNGPKLKVVSEKYPLVPQYFYYNGPDTNLNDDEILMYSGKASYIMAHNGWVMGDNPLRNFAEPGSNVYLRRELIAWGDSCKLRYGDSPEDSPYLWEHMTNYVQTSARFFHGLRLDNCHSTPIHVAEYLIDKAREVRPDLYVIAELFTSSESVDNIFVNRLGITSLIREAMSAPDAHEQGRLVYRYGGFPVGAFIHPVVRPLTMGIAHAIFMDVTHDNPCPIQTRSVYDLFPTAAVVTMACCATGSSRGYDELVSHHIHVVDEKRLYNSWGTDEKSGFVNSMSGIIAGKCALNKLHINLGKGGYSQVFVDQRDADTIAITRHCPATHQSVILIARTSFSFHGNSKDTSYVPPLKIPGMIDEIILEGYLKPLNKSVSHVKDKQFINGLSGYELVLREHLLPYESDMVEVVYNENQDSNDVDFTKFPHGSVIAFRVSLDSQARTSILKIRTCVSQFGYRMRTYSGQMIRKGHDFESIVSRLTLADLNIVLFRGNDEEENDGHGFGVYDIPGYGSFVYCGLQGLMSELMTIHLNNDLGHPICNNLRNGNWLPNYISDRLLVHSSTHDLGQWFKTVFQSLSLVPRYLVPCYFDAIITGAYSSLLTATWRKMSEFVNEGSTFVKSLALGSVALAGVVKSSPLPELSPNLKVPTPPTEEANGVKIQRCTTLSAGLPHFSTGYCRNWGRDTFISLKGLFLIPERIQDARYVILAYAACLRHGLIPNLLDRGVNSRFNCRDAVWWWLQSIQDYTKIIPEGHLILKDKVSRLYPTDDSPPLPPGEHDQLLLDVIQEALVRHYQGVQFRERNAGPQIDQHMQDNGFNNEIGIDPITGFVFGGNADNCGTWMDKMGGSDVGGNKGHPATPRDGSAIELVGLCYSTLCWLYKMYEQGYYPYCMVEKKFCNDSGDEKIESITFADWANCIRLHFEQFFWVDEVTAATDSKYINKRGIYKDSVGATAPWTDFQLRPNFCITMVVAPDLFTPERAWKALMMVEKYLLGPLGMKTLDPEDWAYNGDYDNSDHSTNKVTSGGWNYHQGPEWLWPIGYFLRAKLHFALLTGGEERLKETLNFTKNILSNHYKEIQNSKWKGLPELTNKNGSFCRDSCTIQAWSHATILEVLYEIHQMLE